MCSHREKVPFSLVPERDVTLNVCNVSPKVGAVKAGSLPLNGLSDRGNTVVMSVVKTVEICRGGTGAGPRHDHAAGVCRAASS